MKTSDSGQTDTEQPEESPTVRTVPPDMDLDAGYPDAVAARIGDRDLWIANNGGIDPDNLDTMGIDPDYVVSVNQRPTAATTDHHELDDAYVNAHDEFVDAVEAARNRIQADGTVIVNCAAGVSRSATVIATAIAAEDDIPLDEAISTVKRARKRAFPHSKLRFNGYGYLGDVVDRSGAREQAESIAADLSTDQRETERVEAILELLD